MSDQRKELVKQGYDQMAESYLQWTESQSSPRERYTTKVLKNAPSSPYILELGCGAGKPITRMLLDRGAHVVANDISDKQISMAKVSCPEATCIAGDMLALSFAPGTFDGAVAFFSIFHLPREQQKDMLAKVYAWLKPGTLFAVNFGTVAGEEIREQFLGREMFWSSYDVEQTKGIVEGVGFELVETEILEAGDGKLDQSDPDHGIKFLWITAKKES